MAERDIKWIKEFVVPHLFKSGKLVKENVDYDIKDVTITHLTSKEAFMLTMCYKVKLTYQSRGQIIQKHFVVKRTPDVTEEVYKSADFDSLFHNEITAYMELIPILENNDESSRDDDTSSKSNRYPKYFYSYRKACEAAIVLGDFSLDGWRMSKNLVNLSLDHILLSVKQLGRFHGRFYALKEKNPEDFFNIAKKFKESRYAQPPPPSWGTMQTVGSLRAVQAVKDSELSSKIPEEFLNKLLTLLQNMDYGKGMVEPTEPLSVICHGDYLRNNLAFKYKDQDFEYPVDVMMFDFQTLRYASPMIDLCTFIANSSGVEVRRPNFDLIFNSYYQSLVDTYCHILRKKSTDVPEFLSHDNLLKEYARCLPYGLNIASSFLSALFEPYDLTSEELVNDNRSYEELYQDTMFRAGEDVNVELRALVYEAYELITRFNIDIFQ